MKIPETNTAVSKPVSKLTVGDSARMYRTVHEEDLIQFAELSQDFNPVHLNEEYAKNTRFGGRIAHGLFCSAMVSALLGMELPGLGTIILSESMRFLYPAYVGDTVEARVWVDSVRPEKNRATIAFSCKNQLDRILMEGSAEVTVENK